MSQLKRPVASRPVHSNCLPMSAAVLRERGVLTPDGDEASFMAMTADVGLRRLQTDHRFTYEEHQKLPVLPKPGFSCVVCGLPLLYGQDLKLVPLTKEAT